MDNDSSNDSVNVKGNEVIIKNKISQLVKSDKQIPEDKLQVLKDKGYDNVEVFEDNGKVVFKYETMEGLIINYLYPNDGESFYVLNDEKLKDKEIYSKYINEPVHT